MPLSQHDSPATTRGPAAGPDAELERVRRTWHAISAHEVIRALGTQTSGLSGDEAAARLRRFGANELPGAPPRTLLARIKAQLDNVLIYVLLGSALITALLGHAVDTGVILAVVVINAVFGIIQEGKAERALEAIGRMIAPTASVIRDGQRLSIPARELVPGDVMLIEAGDRIAADARLISARALRIDEAALTGESVPADKRAEADAPDTALAERASMAFAGTLVTAGQGTGIVVATGTASEIGRITAMLGDIPETATPLIRQINAFARQLSFAILAASAAVFLFAVYVRRYPLDEAFLAIVGMAVAAIPEGLPAVMTITLAIGVERMSRRNAIIRRLPAVETLGSVSIICTDKTGTLTLNEMMVRHVATAGATYDVTGDGYAPVGTIQPSGASHEAGSARDDAGLGAALHISALCNDARLAADREGAWHVAGDPMEGALLAFAGKGGIDITVLQKALPRIDVVPFDAAHRFMATLHLVERPDRIERPGSHPVALIKGAPEEIMRLCSGQSGPDGTAALDAAHWLDAVTQFAAAGERTLALALKPFAEPMRDISVSHLGEGLTLVAIVGFIDPPRAEAARAIAEAQEAGIAVKMITGDHARTAEAIARQLGLDVSGGVATGADIDKLDGDALDALAQRAHVFARAAPEHKLKLIGALRRAGATIAMTGDGVNDAPALKSADVGISMGRKGTEAAKEASQMVLADDNFASIVAAVKEGRTVYDNLTKVIAWTLPTSFGETFVVMLAILGGFLLPVTPAQILWINTVTAVALGLVLAFEPAEADVMRRPPRPPGQSLLTPLLVWQIVFVSSLFVAGAFGVFWWARQRGLAIEEARTLVVNTIVVFEIFYLFAIRYLRSGALSLTGVLGTPAVLTGVSVIVVLQLAFTYLPFMQDLFGTRSVSLSDGLAVIALGVALLVVLEIEKALRPRIVARWRGTGPGATP